MIIFNRFFFTVLYMFLLSVGCSVKSASSLYNSNSNKENKEIPNRNSKAYVLKICSYIDSIKSNNEKYIWGEGIANVGTYLGDAKIKARDRALGDLARKISVEIKSEIKGIIIADEKGIAQDDLIEKTTTYTETAIHDVVHKDFLDYPEAGNITCISYISRKKYEEKLKENLESKKAMISYAISKADSDFNDMDYITALNGWFTALEYHMNFFGELPLRDYIDTDSILVEVKSYIYGKINRFIGSLHISFSNDTIVYDVNGQLSSNPIVSMQYKESNGTLIPVVNAPIMIRFTDDLYEPIKLKTDMYGKSECKNIKLDASKSEIYLVAEFNVSEIINIDKINLPKIQTNPFILKKMKTVVISAMINNNGKYLVADDLLVPIKAYILDRKLNVIQIKIESDVSSEQLSSVSKNNGDFLFALNLIKTVSGNVGGYSNVFVAQCKGIIYLYDLRKNSLIATDHIDAVKGFGTTISRAGLDALAKIKKQAQQKAFTVINNIPL